jgi:hypothetical protein
VREKHRGHLATNPTAKDAHRRRVEAREMPEVVLNNLYKHT